jgi:hypothetical protein
MSWYRDWALDGPPRDHIRTEVLWEQLGLRLLSLVCFLVIFSVAATRCSQILDPA